MQKAPVWRACTPTGRALPASALRQSAEGSVMIGVSVEEVGLDTGTTVPELARMAARALTVLPVLIFGWVAQRQLVRGLSFGAVK